MATEDHTMGEASQTPAKRARIDTSGATAKRPRDEATADTLAPAAAAMASALNDLKTQAPALFALVREFEAELTPWLARRAGVETSKPIADLVDILRDQSYLMYQKRDDGSFAYKLTSCQYEGSQTSTHLMGPPPPRPPTQRRVY